MAQHVDKKHVPVTALGREWMEWVAGYPVGADRLAASYQLLVDGRVGELRVDGPAVQASVEDGMGADVELHFLPVEAEVWDLVWSMMTPDALRDFRKGGLGSAVRNAFGVAEIGVLPEKYRDVKTACTCGDWMRPCRHALAVLRALGEEVERDPMLLVRLRGGGPQEEAPVVEVVEQEGEALRTSEADFWGRPIDWSGFEESMLAGGAPSRLLKRLGPVSVYGVRMEPESLFKPVYEGVAAEAKVMIEGIRKKVKQ